jgi:hypothetical protein
MYLLSGINEINKPWDYIGKIDENEDLLISSKTMVSHFATFKRSFYLNTPGIDKTLLSAEDKDLYLKLEEVGELYYYDQPIYYYRVDNQNSISRGTTEKERLANFYLSIAHLKAFSRRISLNSTLYKRNSTLYLSHIYRNLQLYIKNKTSLMLFDTIKYFFMYLRNNKFSFKSIINIIKLSQKVKSMIIFFKAKVASHG